MFKKMLFAFLCFASATALTAVSAFADGGNGERVTENWNDGWSFACVIPGSERKEAVDTMKVGDARIPEPLQELKNVRLPHDWAISGPFDEKYPDGGQGKLPWRAVGWYFKTLTPSDADRAYILDFDGCMAFPEVYVNDIYVGGWDYGYVGFQLDITKYLKIGEKNVIAVRCDVRQHGSRWYPGAGIYRNVKLITCSNDAWLPMGSVFVSTPSVTEKSATVKVAVKPEVLASNVEKDLTVSVEILAPGGQREAKIADYDGTEIAVNTPKLWSPETPNLYQLKVQLSKKNGSVLDSVEIPFGIRSVEWTADDGFYLNGKRYQLYGVNLHHDQGICGAASHPAAVRRQLRIMKDMGVNAIRTSHNPNSAVFMDVCDEMGFVVWNELFDKWDTTVDLLDQTKFDGFTDRQVRQFVARDQNRPSVCVWSIGNEVFDVECGEKGSSNPYLDGPRRVKHIADCYRKYDSTRKVAFGCCISGTCIPGNTTRDAVDVIGWNYRAQYRPAHITYPQKAMVYSESASAVSTRGYYELPHPEKKDIYNHETLQIDGYDRCSVPWGDIPDVEFDRMEKDRYCAGEFVWTGFDYLGEPSPFIKEARSSYFGIVDLCGMPKDRFFLYRSYWNKKDTTVHVLPHWNWNAGDNVPVYVYTNGDEVELFLNGRSLGKKQKKAKAFTLDDAFESVRPKWDYSVKFTASTEETLDGRRNLADKAFDGDAQTRWCASSGAKNEWVQIDFGKPAQAKTQVVRFERAPKEYIFRIEMSQDGKEWETICREEYNAKLGEIYTLALDEKTGTARYYRIVFEDLKPGNWASIIDWHFSEKVVENSELPSYYSVMDKYRLRWENIAYQPGTLVAVAYKNGQEIGRQTVRTAGEVVAIRLTPEKTAFSGDDDLCYVLVEAVDADGNLCPNAMTAFSVTVDGPAELVGIGNGNPMGYDILTDATHTVFYGKAMIVLRSRPSENGENGAISETTKTVTLKATSAGIAGSEVKLNK
ncbi:MAG: glycoside hydrolase family 2 TIM barrel-domain containing protein [Planctomycetia bacterium]|nr:glycoside hydrolase family 2 TIM barrel-domain containing protein [Planctomycetia bacterium]